MQHPMMDLLELTGFKAMLRDSNFSFFSELKKALEKDCQSTLDDNHSSRVFEKPIPDTISLYDNHANILHAMIESWVISVMTPFVDQLNDYNTNTVNLKLVFNGSLEDPRLEFGGNTNWADDFATDMSVDDVPFIKDILQDWQHSIKMISNIDDLINVVDAVAAKTA